MIDMASELRAAGLSATKQRIALLALLRKKRRPLPVEALAAALPSMNMTTVYRGVGDLARVGLVRRIDFGENRALFEAARHHHHHAVCVSCGMVADVEACLPEALLHSAAREAKFARLEDHALEFFGTCTSCA